MTLVDHSRRLLRDRSGAVVDEFSAKLATVLENPEIVFVQDLTKFHASQVAALGRASAPPARRETRRGY